MQIRITDDLNKIASILHTKGFCCYLVGGAVRNQLLGIEEKDYDLASDAYPEDIIRIFNKVIPTGIKHGTVTILFRGQSYEITTFRVDGKYSDGRRPDSIEFTSNIYEDLKRRDFTINSIAYDILKKKLIDPNNGLNDLKNKIIKAIGNPHERFQEDGLRPLRACRFAAQLNFKIEHETFYAIGKSTDKFQSVSKERVYDELVKTMRAEKPSITFNLLYQSGLLKFISKDLTKCKDIKQKERHLYDVFDHLLYTCDNCPQDNIILRFAGLFHDLGKVTVLSINDDGLPTFFNHEKASAILADKIMKSLKFPNKDIQRICHLVSNHMFNYEKNWTDAAIRRFISRVGVDYIDDLLVLQRADLASMNIKAEAIELLNEFENRIKKILDRENAFTIKDLKINGHELHRELKIPQTRLMGLLMMKLLDDILENPINNNKKYLLKRSETIYNELLLDDIKK